MRNTIYLPPGWRVSDVIQETPKRKKKKDLTFQEGDSVKVKDTARSKLIRGQTGQVIDTKEGSVQVVLNGKKYWLSVNNVEKT